MSQMTVSQVTELIWFAGIGWMMAVAFGIISGICLYFWSRTLKIARYAMQMYEEDLERLEGESSDKPEWKQ